MAYEHMGRPDTNNADSQPAEVTTAVKVSVIAEFFKEFISLFNWR